MMRDIDATSALSEAVYALRNAAKISERSKGSWCEPAITDEDLLVWLDNWLRLPVVQDIASRQDIDAQAMEARRAETGTGSVHDSAVPEGNAP